MILEISFQTLNLPAPFAHEYHLKIKLENEIFASFNITYLDREDLDDDIYEEGFSDQTDFSWEGGLHKNWKGSISKIAHLAQKKSRVNKDIEHAQTEIVISYQEDEKVDKKHFFDNDELAQQVQEIIQAIYESANKELPLKIKFLQIINGKRNFTEIVTSFAKREFEIIRGNQKPHTILWKKGIELMSFIYQPSYELDVIKPKKDGNYLSFDHENWFSVSSIEKEEGIIGYEQQLVFLISELSKKI